MPLDKISTKQNICLYAPHCWDGIVLVNMGAQFHPDVMLRNEAKQSKNVLIRPESCFDSLKVLKGLFYKLEVGFHVSVIHGDASVWPLCHEAHTDVLQRWLSFWKFLSGRVLLFQTIITMLLKTIVAEDIIVSVSKLYRQFSPSHCLCFALICIVS